MELQQVGVHHAAVTAVSAIRDNKAPNRFRLVVAEGLWACKTVLAADVPIDTFLYCPELVRGSEAPKRAEELADRARRAYQVSQKTMERIAETRPDGLIAIAETPAWDPETFELGPDALIVVTDAVEIPGNLGTLIRTLDACQADALMMVNKRTRMTHPKVFRGSQGMSLSLPWFDFEETGDAIDWLKRRRFHVYLADTDDSVIYTKADYSGRTAIVVGSERYGVSAPWYQAGFPRIRVPMLGRADSLNVSVSASVLLYEARAAKEGWRS